MTDNREVEEWRDISGWPGYQVSSHGRVRSFRRYGHGRIMAQSPDQRTGYKKVSLKDGVRPRQTLRVHRLVCEAFHGPSPADRPEAAHRDGTRDNNRYTNLRWASRKENVADQIAHGTFRFAQRHKF